MNLSCPMILKSGLAVNPIYLIIDAYYLGFVPPKAEVKKTFFELRVTPIEDLDAAKFRHRRSRSLQRNVLTADWRYPENMVRDDLLMNLSSKVLDFEDNEEANIWIEPIE